MRKKLDLMLFMIMGILTLCSCNQEELKLPPVRPTATASVKDENVNKDVDATQDGNTAGNCMNLGLYVQEGENIFFSMADENGEFDGIAEVDLSSENPRSKISNEAAMSLNIDSDYIYYWRCANDKNDGREGIFRQNRKSLQEECIIDSVWGMSELYLHNNKLFYIGTDQAIYMANTDGKEITKVIDSRCGKFCFYEDELYYIDYKKGNHLYKTKLDAIKPEQVVEDPITLSFAIFKGDIYYLNVNDDNCLYRVDSKGEKKQCVVPAACSSLNVGECLYYSVEKEKAIYSMNSNGSMKKVVDCEASNFGICGNWLCYMVDNESFAVDLRDNSQIVIDSPYATPNR